MKLAFHILIFFLFSSCSSYINKIHSDLDRAEGITAQKKKSLHDSTFNQFKRGNDINSQAQSNYIPEVKRQYQATDKSKQRFTADDLTDNSTQGSLWAGSGNDNFLFTKNKWKRNGDIILVNVQSRLKNDITMELKRAVPAPLPSRPKIDPKTGAADQTAQAPTPVSQEEKDVPDDDKIHDKISSVIVEEISRDHLLIRGQKYLLFRNQKHLVELQALISRKDIMDDDTVNSSSFLESSLVVLR